MSIEYTWHCTEMKVLPTQGDLKDVITFVSWHLNGTDGTFQDNQYGQVAVSAAVLDEFIAFSDLTLTEVIGWVQKELGEDTVKSLQERIAVSINNRANPPYVVMKAPWVVPDEILMPPAPVVPEPPAPVVPEPAAPVETEPAEPVETEPAEPVETEPAEPVESEPAEPVEPETPAPVEPEPAEPVESEPAAPVEPETPAPVESEPAAPVEPETPAPVEPETPAPVESEPAAPVETEPAEPASE